MCLPQSFLMLLVQENTIIVVDGSEIWTAAVTGAQIKNLNLIVYQNI